MSVALRVNRGNASGMLKHDGPATERVELTLETVELLRIARVVATNVRRGSSRRVNVYRPETGEVLRQVPLDDALVGIAQRMDIEFSSDKKEMTRTHTQCVYCGSVFQVLEASSDGRRVGMHGIPLTCPKGCLCGCGKRRVHKGTVLRAVREKRVAQCVDCAGVGLNSVVRDAILSCQGETTLAIARKFGVSKGLVLKVMKERGVKPRGIVRGQRGQGSYKLSQDEIARIRREWSDGAPAKEIAAKFGVAQGTVQHHCKAIKLSAQERVRRQQAGFAKKSSQAKSSSALKAWATRRAKAGK